MKIITEKKLAAYRNYLYEEEKSESTIKKYMCDLQKMFDYIGERELTKTIIIEYKEYLRNSRKYKTSSINSFLVAINRFFEYNGWYELRVKTYKIQRDAFVPESKELSREEYKKLVRTARKKGRERIAMIIQTLCVTGIRVSELSSITVSDVKRGVTNVQCKGKERQVLIPRALQVELLHYIRKQNIKNGVVFRTKKGNTVDRSNIWREMKLLCKEADIEEEKVFPHNLRHLFAKSFYQINKDIAKLADVLGHSSIETTRIYIKTSGDEYRKQLDLMKLIVKLE